MTEASPVGEYREGPPPLAKEIVIGHRKPDIDQAAAYCLLRLGKLVPEQPTIRFTDRVTADVRAAKGVVAIEGFTPATAAEAADTAGLNFANDPETDDPAAWNVFNRLQNVIGQRIPREKYDDLRVFASWIRDREHPPSADELARRNTRQQQQDAKKPLGEADIVRRLRDEAIRSELDTSFTDIFQGLLQTEDSPAAALEQTVQALELTFDPTRIAAVEAGDESQRIEAAYAEAITANREKKDRDRTTIREYLTAPENAGKLRTTVTDQGVQLLSIDISELPEEVDTAAYSVAREVAGDFQPDIQVLVAATSDESGRPSRKLQIKTARENQLPGPFTNVDLRQLAADRLTLLEDSLGTKGSEGYGGHKGVVSSPASTGSSLSADALLTVTEELFDEYHTTADQFSEDARQLATLAGLEPPDAYLHTFLPEAVAVNHAYALPERQLQLRIPGSQHPILIDEKDLPLYQTVLGQPPYAGNQELTLELLRAKTSVSEPAEIVEARNSVAREHLSRYIVDGDGRGVLKELHRMSAQAVDALPLDTMVSLLETISHDEVAIADAYDIRTDRYRVLRKAFMPDTLKDTESPVYKKAMFDFDSVSRRVDYNLVDGVIRRIGAVSDSAERNRLAGNYADALRSILTSAPYRESREHGHIYDQLLHSTLRFCTSEAVDPEIQRRLLTDLIGNGYSQEDGIHQWRTLYTYDRNSEELFIQACLRHYDILQPIEASLMGAKAEVQAKAEVHGSGSRERPINPDDVAAHIARQLEAYDRRRTDGELLPADLPPTITIGLQIGDRDLAAQISARGISRIEQDGIGQYILEKPEQLDALILGGTLKLGRQSGFADERIITGRVIQSMREAMQALPSGDTLTKIRFVNGGLPGVVAFRLGQALQEAIATDPLFQEKKNQIVLSTFNNEVYEDMPLEI